ncbi:hypothetical protein FHR70_000746 [Microvirga lupini]|uniref:Uncharacterized protein n=1 Tax=Microvirga lupini TaxID=420324 RepID=A0A7W4YVB3_9HYPH|nr:hypothetical protein [Microvirga lupini]MBB3017706.1 hypothetical protein [Microvirga lupini]
MTTIIAGSPASFSVTVQANGQPVPITGGVEARVFSMDGKQEFVPAFPAQGDASGAVAVELDDTQTGTLPAGDVMLVLSGGFGIKRFKLTVETLFEPTRTSLFIKDIIIEELRNDRLMAAAAGVLQDVVVSDDYLWDKIRAAESELSHTLRVPLVPTRFFPNQPTQEQIDALDGMAWAVEVGNDYDPTMWQGDKWGFIVTRERPIISIDDLVFRYPGGSFGVVNIPPQWINVDAKYGHVRIVPTTSVVYNGMAGAVMMAGVSGRIIPSMIQMTYTAGLTDVANTYPELLDAIKKKAVLKVVGDTFLPQSGSISADGLSQSLSADMGKYYEAIDHIINGPAGSNGGLMSKIHGIRMMVM